MRENISNVRDVLIRGIDIEDLGKIKARAKKHNRSLQAEMKIIFSKAANQCGPMSQLELLREFRASLTKVNRSDTVQMLRDDRDR